MTLSIHVPDIPEELLHRLDERASRAGVDRAAYVRQLLERDLLPPHAEMTFREILAPVHAAPQAMAEHELEQFLTEELDASRRERRNPPGRAQ